MLSHYAGEADTSMDVSLFPFLMVAVTVSLLAEGIFILPLLLKVCTLAAVSASPSKVMTTLALPEKLPEVIIRVVPVAVVFPVSSVPPLVISAAMFLP